MTFGDLLARWNGGRIRGAQTRFAARLGIAPHTVSQWATGVSRPDADLRPRAARELGVAVEVLANLFESRRRTSQDSLREVSDGGRRDGAIPVFGPVHEEPFFFDFDAGVPEEILPLSVASGYGGARGAAIRIKGGHWAPLAEDGDYLLFAECSVAPDGKWVLVRREDGCRLRRLKAGPARSDEKERVLAVLMGRFRRV